jgi:hypothetical protein
MLFAELTSDVAADRRDARARLEKIGLLSDLLRRLAPDEIDPAVAFLSGQLRQGKDRPRSCRRARRGGRGRGAGRLAGAHGRRGRRDVLAHRRPLGPGIDG